MKTLKTILFLLVSVACFAQGFPVDVPNTINISIGHEQRAFVNASQLNGNSAWIKYDARGFKYVVFTFSENVSLFSTFAVYGSNNNIDEEQVLCYPISGNYPCIPTASFIPGVAAHSVAVPVTHNYIILRCLTFPGSSWNGIRVTAVATNTDIQLTPRIPAGATWSYNTLPASAITNSTPVLIKDKVAGGSSTPYGMQYPVTKISLTNTGGTGTFVALINTASPSNPPTAAQIIWMEYIEANTTRTFEYRESDWLYPGWNPIYAYVYAASGASVTLRVKGTNALSTINN